MIGCIRQRGTLPWALASGIGGAALGIAFLLALAWLIAKLGDLRRWIALSPAQRETERMLRLDRFYPVCGRARAAYLILCFEEALRTSGLPLDPWDRVRRELWSVTERSAAEWLARIGDLLPETVLQAASLEGLLAERAGDPFPGYAYSKAEYEALRALYRQAGDALEPLAFLMERIFDAVESDSDETGAVHPLEAVGTIRQAEAFLDGLGVPLPQDEAAVAFLLRKREPYFGKPFPPLYPRAR